jgi:hypothetical protein
VKDLEDMAFGHRVVVLIVFVVLAILIMALVGFLSGRWDVEAQPLPPVPLSKYERQLIDLDRAAISMAYHDQVHDLFRTWAKDGTDQPRRAVRGARQARSMYEQSMMAVEEREQRLNAR